mgnify:CR=1 FL=1
MLFRSGRNSVTLNLVPILNANGTASVTVTVTDNEHVVVQTFTITVNAVNDAPTLGALDDVEVNEDAGPSNVALVVSDVDDALSELNYQVASTNAELFSELNVEKDNTGATLNIGYAANANGVAEVTVVVTDLGGLSGTQTFTITVNPVNDAPELLGDRDAIVYEDGQDAMSIVPNNFEIVHVDIEDIASASIQIGNWVDGDTVTWNASLGGGIAITTRNEGAGLVIDLSGSSSTTNYRAAIASIGYETTKTISSVSTKSIVIEVSDGALVSDPMALELELIPDNREPVLSGDVSTIAYTEQGAGVAIASSNIQILDDGNIASAIIKLEPAYEGDALNVRGSMAAAIAVRGVGTSKLIMEGEASREAYENAIRVVVYENELDTVVGGIRVVSIRVKDALEYSAALTRNVVVTAVNDEPVVSGDNSVIYYRLGDASIAIVPDDFSIEDVDDTTIASASIALNPVVAGDGVTVDASVASELGIGVEEGNGELVLTGPAGLSEYINVLKTTEYSSSGEANITRDVAIRVSDGQGGQSNTLVRSIVVMPAPVEPGPSPINVGPVVSANSEIRIVVSGNVDEGTVTHNVLVVEGDLTIESPAQLTVDLSQLEGTLAVGATLNVIRVSGTLEGSFSGVQVVGLGNGASLGFKIVTNGGTIQLVAVANTEGSLSVGTTGSGIRASVEEYDGIQGEVRYTWLVADAGSDNWEVSRTARGTATSPTTSVDTFVLSNETEGKDLRVRVEYKIGRAHV